MRAVLKLENISSSAQASTQLLGRFVGVYASSIRFILSPFPMTSQFIYPPLSGISVRMRH